MPLSDEQITKYQELYRNLFGKEISRAEALDNGSRLIRLLELVYKPITEEQYQELQKRRQDTKN